MAMLSNGSFDLESLSFKTSSALLVDDSWEVLWKILNIQPTTLYHIIRANFEEDDSYTDQYQYGDFREKTNKQTCKQS